uniref:VWFA domain-containing protein n=1 Tax=Pygocentrus nattereri TaxID=42514 RepID=A0AAR2IQU5_PYGNA
SGPEDALFGFSVLQVPLSRSTVTDCSPSITGFGLRAAMYSSEYRTFPLVLYTDLIHSVAVCLQACAPLWSQECGTSVFSTGICASVDNKLQPTETIAPTAQRCTTYMDIVIVLDGSNSIYPWYEVQNFLSNILSKFHISPEQMQVGVLQYGEISIHEWSLKDYQSTQDVVEAAKNISRQEGRETRTAYAIHMACTEAFSAERGARDGATKVMIVVTDGESHDGEELPEALDECEKRNITRYAIAVLGHYIRRQQDPETFINEIKYIASDPDDKYFFNVTDEAALNDIVDALGDRIFSLEGTLSYNESAFLMEMSQIGFSTHILDDGILFGMVGAYDWEGGVLKESNDGRIMPPREAFEKEFPLELKNHAAYLGYTVSSVTVGDWRRLYVAGAPRFKHKGKVILFDLSQDGDVTITQALNGEQIGSYFGSEVCGVDVDQDGITDILLIAAPMFLGAGNKETGKVYIYCLDGEGFAPNGTLQAQSKAQDARFGYAMAVAPDLNHDGYADLLVGAPLEDDHQGALYIYHGDEYYIIPQYKQRISGSSLSPGLQYFGRSLSALLDMDGDELLDLAVGAQGSAVLLRSRSIVQINVSLSFQPHSINVIQKNCHRGGRESACLNASACFFANSHLQVGAMLDDRKLSARALFDSNSQRQTVIGVRVQVGNTLCQTLPFHVFDTADYIRPISFSLHFKINDTESGPVLDEGWPTTVKKTIPFYKDCGEDDVCVTDLNLKRISLAASCQCCVNITVVRACRQQPYVIRSPRRRLAVEVQLQNRLENAYNTSLTLTYSRNLHFSSLSIRVNKCTESLNHRYPSLDPAIRLRVRHVGAVQIQRNTNTNISKSIRETKSASYPPAGLPVFPLHLKWRSGHFLVPEAAPFKVERENSHKMLIGASFKVERENSHKMLIGASFKVEQENSHKMLADAPFKVERENSHKMLADAPFKVEQENSHKMLIGASFKVEQENSNKPLTGVPFKVGRENSNKTLTGVPFKVERENSHKMLADAPFKVERENSHKMLADAPFKVERENSHKMLADAPFKVERENSHKMLIGASFKVEQENSNKSLTGVPFKVGRENSNKTLTGVPFKVERENSHKMLIGASFKVEQENSNKSLTGVPFKVERENSNRR